MPKVGPSRGHPGPVEACTYTAAWEEMLKERCWCVLAESEANRLSTDTTCTANSVGSTCVSVLRSHWNVTAGYKAYAYGWLSKFRYTFQSAGKGGVAECVLHFLFGCESGPIDQAPSLLE